jgi:hypothetical protein
VNLRGNRVPTIEKPSGLVKRRSKRGSSAHGKTIIQDCSACHEIVVTSEASPQVLQTLGVEKRLEELQKE